MDGLDDLGDLDDATYPPEPWDLHGHCLVTTWLVPAEVAPPPPGPGSRPVRLLGRRLVTTAFFVYEPPSPLTYGEVMAVVPVVDRGRPRFGLTHIWVDSPASLAGGRALWGIPKDLADFELTPGSWAAPGIASASLRRPRPTRRTPWLPVRFALAQDRRGEHCLTPVRGRARLVPVTARWTIDPAGPLSFLTGARPLLSLHGSQFRLRFGTPPAG